MRPAVVMDTNWRSSILHHRGTEDTEGMYFQVLG